MREYSHFLLRFLKRDHFLLHLILEVVGTKTFVLALLRGLGNLGSFLHLDLGGGNNLGLSDFFVLLPAGEGSFADSNILFEHLELLLLGGLERLDSLFDLVHHLLAAFQISFFGLDSGLVHIVGGENPDNVDLNLLVDLRDYLLVLVVDCELELGGFADFLLVDFGLEL